MRIRLETTPGKKQTILEALRDCGITALPTPCGGRGRCGKCSVHVEGQERDVLACTTRAQQGMVICLPEAGVQQIAEEGHCAYYAADGTKKLAAACDIGTTTVVCHLVDGESGQILGTVSEENAQKIYGADVISRIQAAKEGNLTELQHRIAGQISGMLATLLSKYKNREEYLPEIAESGANQVELLAVSGNAVMCHLLAGISPESIGKAPFLPADYFGRSLEGGKLGLSGCRQVYIAPSVSGYVGGDITADLLAVTPGHEEDITLLLDIGTNGEMALGKKGNYVCCAAAAGPAFEGAEIAMGMPACEGAVSKVFLDHRRIRTKVIGDGKAKGICGSGLLDALAVFLKMGLIETNGRIRSVQEVPAAGRKYLSESDGQNCIMLTDGVFVTQQDIRNLQMAKAAIAAGIRILMTEADIDDRKIDRLVLAGGFGSFLNPESAAAVGLIPKELLPVTAAVGNAAGAGAVSAAVSKEARQELSRIRKSMHYLELSSHPDFEEYYLENMNFP